MKLCLKLFLYIKKYKIFWVHWRSWGLFYNIMILLSFSFLFSLLCSVRTEVAVKHLNDQADTEINGHKRVTEKEKKMKQASPRTWNQKLPLSFYYSSQPFHFFFFCPAAFFFSLFLQPMPNTVWTKLAKPVHGNSNIPLPESSFGVSVREMKSKKSGSKRALVLRWPLTKAEKNVSPCQHSLSSACCADKNTDALWNTTHTAGMHFITVYSNLFSIWEGNLFF